MNYNMLKSYWDELSAHIVTLIVLVEHLKSLKFYKKLKVCFKFSLASMILMPVFVTKSSPWILFPMSVRHYKSGRKALSTTFVLL